MKTFDKDPDAVLDYYWDWSDWLTEGDSIDSVEFIISEDGTIAVDDFAIAGDKVMGLISGGTENTFEDVTCRVSTVGPPVRTDDRTARFFIIPK